MIKDISETVCVLGADYTIERRKASEDAKLINAGGYCDYSIHSIVLDAETDDDNPEAIANMDAWRDRALRHEIIHAFLFESGLYTYSGDETIVDWMAAQLPKLVKAMRDTGCLE